MKKRRLYLPNNDINKLYDIPKEYWEAYNELITISITEKIDVVYNNQFRELVDKHFGDDTLCYLANNNSVPVKKSDLKVTEKGLRKFKWCFDNKKDLLVKY